MEEIKTDEAQSITLALRLGWSLGEFMGRARRYQPVSMATVSGLQGELSPRELRGFGASEAPRLTYSNRYFSEEGAWWQAALRTVSLADQLNLLSEKSAQTEEIQALPEQAYGLTFGGEVESENCTPRDFYELLEPWSREVGTNLATRFDQAALAFRAGGQIADTYWYMRDKEHHGEPRDLSRQDSWHELLNHKRLMTVIEDIKRFEGHLPNLVGPCLRFSLYRWAIAHDLEYQGEGLTLVRRQRHKDPQADREKGGILKRLEPKDEAAILWRLSRQAEIWQALILGTRIPESYLNRHDTRLIVWRSLARYSLLVVAAVAGLSVTGYALIVLLGGWLSLGMSKLLGLLAPSQGQPETLNKSLSLVTESLPLVAGAIVFATSLLRDGWIEAHGLWDQVRAVVKEDQVKRSTWVPVGLSTRWYRWRHWRRTD
jgi:hypothetical protein